MTSLYWEKVRFEGHEAWRGCSSMLELTLIPSLGSKVVSLRDAATGREWLSRTTLPLGNAGYASSFAEGDGSGWDEMFPTVDACRLRQSPWAGIDLPDHGEVWSLAWQCGLRDDRFLCEVEGRSLPYRLEKTYSFTEEGRLRIDYTAHNLGADPLPFLWAAHPLFQVEAGMEIIVPAKFERIAVSYSHNRRLGDKGTLLPWPRPLPDVSLNIAEAATAKTAEKFYFDGTLPEGRASLYDPASEEMLTMTFPKEQVPYLAVWANYGGYSNQYHIALEPATGFLDDASAAWEEGETSVIPGYGRYEWHLELELANKFNR
ncbi:hypothetical protein [Paenibacillus sp. BK720]|uniref:hypothetical protein n=1 Tax=Paenibacillus sp. BK720 TaxID=2587092 RepID=UPI00141EF342|nr:hypothetical protein [Paenibacillus sp. BK720]NIK70372.1 galactose mutarotase-like enzyme [Paenibacillus sp. BK720]